MMSVSPLEEVFRTYWTRPLNLVLCVPILGLTVALFFQLGPTVASPIGPELSRPAPREMINTSPGASVAASPDSHDFQARTLNVLAHPMAPFPDLSQFSQVQTLDLPHGVRGSQGFGDISPLRQLKTLSLSGGKIPAGLLAQLGSRLEELEIDAEILKEHAHELPSLQRLRLLQVTGKELSPQTLQAISSIPHLRILKLRAFGFIAPIPDQPGVVTVRNISAADLTPLKGHPTLRDVYYYQFSRKEAQLAASEFRPLRLLPLHWPDNQPYSVIFTQLLLFGVSLLIGSQLIAQFTQPSAPLMPNFYAPHLYAALWISGVVASYCLFVLLVTGTAILPALAGVLFVPAMAGVLLISQQTVPQTMDVPLPKVGFSAGSLGFVLFFLLGLIIFSFGLPHLVPMSIWGTSSAGLYLSYFQGHMPAISLGWLILELGMLRFTALRISQFGRIWNEKFASRPEYTGWSFQGKHSLPQLKEDWRIKRSDPGLRSLHYHEGRFWSQVSLWRLGNPYRPARVICPLLLFLGAVALLLSTNSLTDYFQIPANLFWSFINTFSFQFTFITLLTTVYTWFNRCRQLSQEAMRPVARPQWIRQLFVALWLDQSWAIVPAVLGLGAYLLLNAQLPWDQVGWHLTAALFVGLLWLMICSTAVFAFQQTWKLIAVLVPLCLVPFVGYGLFIHFVDPQILNYRFDRPDYERVYLLGPYALAWLLIMPLILQGMYQKAYRREWD